MGSDVMCSPEDVIYYSIFLGRVPGGISLCGHEAGFVLCCAGIETMKEDESMVIIWLAGKYFMKGVDAITI